MKETESNLLVGKGGVRERDKGGEKRGKKEKEVGRRGGLKR